MPPSFRSPVDAVAGSVYDLIVRVGAGTVQTLSVTVTYVNEFGEDVP